MRARFIGDPAEREGGKPLSRDAGEWFEVADPAHFAKLSNNAHYEIEGVAIIGAAKPAPKRTRAKPAAPKIETDGWEGDE
jgi:hypothetical protein